jgi:tRNA wybutosine-synthesizing protein 4
LLSREPSLCENASFIDIDYEKLMFTKRDAIQRNDVLNDLVPMESILPKNESVVMRSEHYLGIGCDLKNIQKLEDILSREFDLSQFSIFCTAEVSLTYMDVKSADALIHWVSKLSNG